MPLQIKEDYRFSNTIKIKLLQMEFIVETSPTMAKAKIVASVSLKVRYFWYFRIYV